MDNRRYRNIRRSRHCALLYLRNTLVGIVTAALAGCGVSMKPQAAQTITFTQNPPASAPFGGQFTVAASASSGLAVTFTSSGVCTNSGATYTMTSGAGVCSIIASQSGDANYTAAQATQTVAATLAAQTIAFTANAPASAPYNGQFTVAATATSGLAVAFTSSGACTNSGATYTMTSGAGVCSIIANQPGNANYAAAPQVTQAAAATLASQTIAFTENPPASAPYNSQFTVAAGATSGLAVTFTSSGACTNSGATYTVNSATGVCSVIANQPGNADYAAAPQVTQAVAATPASQTITFTTNAPANAPYNSQFTVAASATSGLAVTFTSSGACTNSGATYTVAGSAGICTVIANQAGNADYAAAPQVTETVNAAVLTANVCPAGQTTPAPCSENFTLAFNIPAGTTIASVNILTSGAPNLDFQAEAGDTSTTLCIPQAYPDATTCTVDVTFAPIYPGARSGAVQLLSSNGSVVAGTSVSGIGLGPAIVFTPANQSALTGGPGFTFGEPASIAVDGAGDLFVADFGNDAVYEMLAASGYTTINTLGGGFAFGGPAGVSLDGAGNLFVADYYKAAVYELPAAGGYSTANPLGALPFGQPTDVAVDSNGDLFVSDSSGAVFEVLAAGGYTTVNRIATSFTFGLPSGLAVDGAGNVFVSDSNNVAVYEILAAGGYTTVNQLAAGFAFKSPLGVSVDTAENVFVADGDFTTVFEILPTDGYTQVVPLGAGLGSPWSLTVGANGNLYIADVSNTGGPSSIQMIQRAQPPAFNFASTAVGSTSTDSPQSVSIQNTGNEPLNAIPPGLVVTGPNFVQVPGSGTPADCTASFTLTPGATCNLSLSFEPQSAGPLTSTAVFTDNTLNANPATQSITLTGTGTNAP